MSKFTHYEAALKTAFYGYWLAHKEKLGIRKRPASRVMHAGMDHAVERYARICRTLY